MYSAITDILSISRGSVTGFTFDARKIMQSIFATAGLIREFFLGSMLSTEPVRPGETEIPTLSPTRGTVFPYFSLPLDVQV